MPRPSASQRKALRAAAVPVALLASGALVWQGSYAAFTAESSSAASNWSAGKVSLTNDYAASAAFSATNIRPNQTDSKCITVTNTSDYDGGVEFWATATPGSGPGSTALASALNLTVTRGATCATATTPVAAGAMNALSTPSVDQWGSTTAVGASPSQAYVITWTLPAATDSSAADGSVSTVFTWKLNVPNAA